MPDCNAIGHRSSVADAPLCVLLCVDNGYLPQATVVIASILDANPQARLEICLAVVERDRRLSETLLSTLSGRHPACRIVVHDVDAALFAGLPTTHRFSRSIYTRLLLDRFIDPRHRRVLYLDADMFVQADLRPLWNIPLDGAVLAAVPDHFRLDGASIGFGEDEPYLNSGLLLIDMRAWRDSRAEARVLDVLARQGAALPWMDQDALNIALRGQVRFVGLEWNFQPRCADVPARFLGLGEAEHAAMRRRPNIVHYTTSLKPWTAPHRVHYSGLFLDQARSIGVAGHLRPPPPRGLAERAAQAKRRMRWHFPGVFRFARRLLKPGAAAMMYRAHAQG